MISFASAHPELVPEWDSANTDCKPEKISYGSNRKVSWIGKCGHAWTATIKNRSNGSGCPFCSGNRVLPGFNDLQSQYPVLAKEWSKKNEELSPSEVTVKANRKVWWECSKCSQLWQAKVSDRTEGHGCPVCTGEKLVPGVNDLAVLHPDLAEEWADENGELRPDMVWPRSRQNVWWKCRICGHSWMGVINSRVKGQGCPACRKRENARVVVDPAERKVLEEEMRKQAIRSLASLAGVDYVEEDDSVIGIPIQFYFPDRRLGIEFNGAKQLKRVSGRRENAKNWLCSNAGIRLVRILFEETTGFDNCYCIRLEDCSNASSINTAILTAFRIGGITVNHDETGKQVNEQKSPEGGEMDTDNKRHIRISSFGNVVCISEEDIVLIPIEQLHEFKAHPFRVRDDEAMEKLVESVKEQGVLVPVIVRKNGDAEYEIISGHRRKRAAEQAELKEIPAIIRQLSDDEAIISMVDANLQREEILPSEKAFSYKMKLEAMKRQGKRTDLTSDNGCQKLSARKKMAQESGESEGTVENYIRLTYLIPEFLDMLDRKQILFRVALCVASLKREEQGLLYELMKKLQAKLSISQAERLKDLSKEGMCTKESIFTVISESPPKERKFVMKSKKLSEYFPPETTEEEIEKVIYRLLEQWKASAEQGAAD